MIIRLWLLSIGAMGTTLFTPLEFSPLPLENIPRWGFWGLAFPACRMLGVHIGVLPKLWRAVPWVLWAPLLVVQALWMLLSVPETLSGPWSKAFEPMAGLFARQEKWVTIRVLFRRGWQVVAVQQIAPMSFYPRCHRTAMITPLLPGLQWATRLEHRKNEDCVLGASWQIVAPQELIVSKRYPFELEKAVQLSCDSALLHALHTWQVRRRQYRTIEN